MYCVLTAGDDNADANPNNIIFTIKDTKLYVPVVNLSARDNKKLSKLFGRVFEGSVYLNEYRTNSENKNTTNDYRCFLKSNFVGVNRLLFQVIQIKMPILKDLKLNNIIYQKELLVIITS